MNIALLHISDLHVRNRKALKTCQIKKIAATFNAITRFDEIVIIVSGDIAFSGQEDQYLHASQVIGHLITALRETTGHKQPINVIFVPGNHDLDHNGKPVTSGELQEIRNKGQYPDHIQCFGINADILIFLSYLTDNPNILQLVFTAATESTRSWGEFDFNENLPGFLQNQRSFSVSLPAPNALSEEVRTAVDVEREAEERIQVADIYDYCEEDADQFINQFIRGVQLLTVVARCLPSLEHIMRKEDKRRLVEAIYVLPNRLFSQWANEANKEVAEILEYFREQSQDYYAREKKISDEELLLTLQWSAMSLLLDLYHLPVFYATRENTIAYLSNYNYSSRQTYMLEHLMMLERQPSCRAFIDEAIKMLDEVKGGGNLLYSTMICRVVRHALVFRTDLSYAQVQKLQTKFFPGARIGKDVLLQRQKNKENDIE